LLQWRIICIVYLKEWISLMKTKALPLLALLVLTTTAAPAFAELVIITNPKNPATRMFPSQAAQFFLGSSVLFTPVEQPENSAIRAEFYKKVLDKEPAQVQAIWSKLVFTGKGKAPKECKSSAEVKKVVSENVSAIGYIEKSAVDDTVKVLATVQ
jgi:ABC-type phosphate transport system substrate-binding protein